MRIFLLSPLFRLVQVLGKRKFLPCQVGGEFPFTLVVDGHAPEVQSDHLPHELHQAPSAPFSFCDFPCLRARNSGFLFGPVFWFFFLGAVLVCFGGVSPLLVVRISLASLLRRKSAPPASRPQWRPPPVVN